MARRGRSHLESDAQALFNCEQTRANRRGWERRRLTPRQGSRWPPRRTTPQNLNLPPRGRGGRERRNKKLKTHWSVPKRPATRPGTTAPLNFKSEKNLAHLTRRGRCGRGAPSTHAELRGRGLSRGLSANAAAESLATWSQRGYGACDMGRGGRSRLASAGRTTRKAPQLRTESLKPSWEDAPMSWQGGRRPSPRRNLPAKVQRRRKLEVAAPRPTCEGRATPQTSSRRPAAKAAARESERERSKKLTAP